MDKFKGKGLFVFSDPGAAKAVLAQAYALKNTLKEINIISDRNYSFFKDFGFTVSNSAENPDEIVKQFNPDFLFTGTSYTSKIELNYILAAKKFNIPSYAFIDHWTSIKERFIYNDSSVFPDSVLVIDEKAKQLSISNNIDPSIIQIFGNPYYSYLKNWKPSLSKAQLLSLLNIDRPKSKLLVFAPEPLSNVSGKKNFGFDEIEATEIIKTILENNNFDLDFVLKVHPNQNMKRLKSVIGNKIIIADSEIDSNLLIFYADIIIGFFSNFLIEASIMDKKIWRYHLNKIKNDPIIDLNIGKIIDSIELVKELEIINGTE